MLWKWLSVGIALDRKIINYKNSKSTQHVKDRNEDTCVCVRISYSVLLDSAFGLVQLVLQVPDDLSVFNIALLYKLLLLL